MTHPYNFYENETEKFMEKKNMFMDIKLFFGPNDPEIEAAASYSYTI